MPNSYSYEAGDVRADADAAWELAKTKLTKLEGLPALYVGLIKSAFEHGYIMARKEERLRSATRSSE